MAKKKDSQQKSFLNEMQFDEAVEMLCHQITTCHHNSPDPEMAIVVDVAITDVTALKLGWPSAKLMRRAIDEALQNLPQNIAERVELDEV